MSNWREDMSTSEANFRQIVWPEISDWFGEDTTLYATENKSDELRRSFDVTAGVDFWVVESGLGMVSIASRVQTYDMTTFTIRYSRKSGAETEYQKRVKQLNGDYELPTWTVQAYIDPILDVLRNAAAIKTDRLYEYILTQEIGEDFPLIDSDESEQFFPVEWRELDRNAQLKVHNRKRADLVQNKTTEPNNHESKTLLDYV